MPQVNRVKRLPPAVQHEIENRLIQTGFSGYEQLAEELTARGHRISKSSLGRYGHLLKEQIRENAGTERTLITVVDRHNGRARIINSNLSMPEIVRLLGGAE